MFQLNYYYDNCFFVHKKDKAVRKFFLSPSFSFTLGRRRARPEGVLLCFTFLCLYETTDALNTPPFLCSFWFLAFFFKLVMSIFFILAMMTT